MLSPTERRTLVLTVFTAACVSFAPAQIVSGVVLLIAAGLIHRWDRALSRKEEEAEEQEQADPVDPPG